MVSSAFLWRPATSVLIEPGASILWQRLRAARMRDGDGIDVSIGAPRRVTIRAGARASVSFRPEGRMLRAWSPYLDVRYGMARDAGAQVRSAGLRLPAARAGRSMTVATGAVFDLGSRWTAHADTTIDLGRGEGAESGRTARLGVVKTF
jgi:outer membrane autotransporter protein